MQIGQLEHRITLQSLVKTKDAGDVKESYVDVVTVPARVITQRGAEAFTAARLQAIENVRVLMRYRDDVKTTWRFKWNGQFYNVTAVDRSKQRQGELWITGELREAL